MSGHGGCLGLWAGRCVCCRRLSLGVGGRCYSGVSDNYSPIIWAGNRLICRSVWRMGAVLSAAFSADFPPACLLHTGCLADQMLADRNLHIPRTIFNLPFAALHRRHGVDIWQTTSTWDGLKEIGKWVEITLIMWLVIASGERLVRRRRFSQN